MLFILRYFFPQISFLLICGTFEGALLLPIDRLGMLAGIAGDKNDEVIRVFNSTGSWAAPWARGKINIYTTS